MLPNIPYRGGGPAAEETLGVEDAVLCYDVLPAVDHPLKGAAFGGRELHLHFDPVVGGHHHLKEREGEQKRGAS